MEGIWSIEHLCIPNPFLAQVYVDLKIKCLAGI